jgi:hypothetical protein
MAQALQPATGKSCALNLLRHSLRASRQIERPGLVTAAAGTMKEVRPPSRLAYFPAGGFFFASA